MSTLCDHMDYSTPGFPVLHYLRISSNSLPLSHWYYLTISFSVNPFFSYPQSFPESGPFLTSVSYSHQLAKSIRASASASVLPMTIQGWFPLSFTGLISLLSKELWSLPQHHISKESVLWHSAFFVFQLSHPYIFLEMFTLFYLIISPSLEIRKALFRFWKR